MVSVGHDAARGEADAPAVCVIGDATLDVTVSPRGELRRGGDAPAEITLQPGGQGANVAVRLARRGVPVRLVAPLADDAAGAWLRHRLEAEGVGLVAAPAARTSAVVALLDGTGERTMLSDRVALRLDPAGVHGALGGARWIQVSGYVLRDEAEAAALVPALRARPAATRLGVAGGSFPPGPDAARIREQIAGLAPDLLAVSQDEARALLADPALTAQDAALALAPMATVVVVTAGAADPAAALAGAGLTPATARGAAATSPVLDTTGAGDALVAMLVACLVEGPWPPDADAMRAALERGRGAGAAAARVRGAQGRLPDEPEEPDDVGEPHRARENPGAGVR